MLWVLLGRTIENYIGSNADRITVSSITFESIGKTIFSNSISTLKNR